jgi:hypothetical protein
VIRFVRVIGVEGILDAMEGPVLTVEESEAKVRGLEVERPEESDIVWMSGRDRSVPRRLGFTVALIP